MAHTNRQSFLALLFVLVTLFTFTHAQAAAPVAAPAAPVAEPAPAVPVAPVAPAPPPAAPAVPAPAAPAAPAAGMGGVGVGGAAGVPVLAPTQYPTVMTVPKIITVTGADGKVAVTSTETLFTQTFASTALGEWRFRSVRSGSVGLGGLSSGLERETGK